MKCAVCGHTMNHHADKMLLNSIDGGDEPRPELIEAYTCPNCGANDSRIVEFD